MEVRAEVKDVANFFGSLDRFDELVIAEFYDEGGYYIGQIKYDNIDGSLTISKELRTLWRNQVKLSHMYTDQSGESGDLFSFIVMKGEEK